MLTFTQTLVVAGRKQQSRKWNNKVAQDGSTLLRLTPSPPNQVGGCFPTKLVFYLWITALFSSENKSI